jgi:hypothetical protein
MAASRLAPLAKPTRLRRRPDPFAAVTSTLREWFEAEPWHTSRQLLERLQDQHPGIYPNGLLRTLQRRLKVWRREAALRMVFGTVPVDPSLTGSGKDCINHSVAGQQYPLDLPLRLDDANASPTTPQGPQQQIIHIDRKEERGRAREAMRQREHAQ